MDPINQQADEQVGANVRTIRERLGISQTELARRMTSAGHPWHQATVSRVEIGRQPVSLVEAVTLADMLGTSVDRLTWAPAEARIAEYLNDGAFAVINAAEDVADSVRRLLGAVATVQADTARHERHPSSLVQEARTDALGRVAEFGDVADAVAEGGRRHAAAGRLSA